MTFIEPSPAAPPSPRSPFQFTLRTLLLLFVVLGSSLAVFGAWGVLVFALVVGLAIYFNQGGTFASLTWLILLVLCLMCLVGLLMPAVRSAHEAGRSACCRNNLKQIIVALLSYEAAKGSFPPAYIADKTGKPMHSWRTLLLPYMEYQAIYKAYNLSEAWDGPNNRKIAGPIPTYVCPSNGRSWATSPFETSYVAVVGPNSAWSGDKPRNFADVARDASHTIMLVESTSSGVAWAEPKDLSVDMLETADCKPCAPTVSSNHGPHSDFLFIYEPSVGANVAMADGSVHFLRTAGLSTEELRKILEIGGCKDKYLDSSAGSYVGRRLNWPNIAALAVWFISVGTLLTGAVRSRKSRSIPPLLDPARAPRPLDIV
jgi:prepilin-type processing-associated H-X9-DG protein